MHDEPSRALSDAVLRDQIRKVEQMKIYVKRMLPLPLRVQLN